MDPVKSTKKKLSPSMEDYLAAVSVLQSEKGTARVKDIGERLSVKPPSVNAALKALAIEGYVVHEKYGYPRLTKRGEEIAKEILRKHKIMHEFLTSVLGIDDSTAMNDACGMEHCISTESLDKFIKFIEFVSSCPKEGKSDCLRSFKKYVETGTRISCED